MLRGGVSAFVIAKHEVGVIESCGDAGIEASRFMVGEQSGLQQAAVAEDVAEPGEEFGIGMAPGGQVEETLQGLETAALIDLKVSVEIVRERNVGAQFKGLLKSFFGRTKTSG